MHISILTMLQKIRPLWLVQSASHKRVSGKALVCTVSKRGSMLATLIQNHSSKKGWDVPIRPNPTKKEGIFNKVSRPTKRRLVLNNLFIENITNVIATGDVAPELMGHGIEITGVKVSSDYTILNVYWQVPASKFDSDIQLHAMLAAKAPHIRSELISRNVLGKVPHIHFIRDVANARIAAFEEALASADTGPNEARPVPEQDFLKDICSFKTPRERKEKSKEKEAKACDESTGHDTQKPETQPPGNPKDMITNIYNLNHDVLMNRIIQAKTKSSSQIKSVVTSKDDDLFSRIPGVPLQADINRKEILKKFCIDRKVKMEALKANSKTIDDNNIAELYSGSENTDYQDIDFNFEPDYYDEEQYINYSNENNSDTN